MSGNAGRHKTIHFPSDVLSVVITAGGLLAVDSNAAGIPRPLQRVLPSAQS